MIIKVCGMREPENIRQATELAIDWIGFIFYNKSPRFINGQLPDINYTQKKVGVFVNASVEEITKTASAYHLDSLQLHGNEPPNDCLALHKQGYSIMKAFSISSAEDLKLTKEYTNGVDYFLFDTKCNSYGGSGKSFDWSVLQTYKEKTPFLLSGGINSNSTEAIKKFSHPQWAGIDLNSGFEIEPGLKDIDKLNGFIKEMRNK